MDMIRIEALGGLRIFVGDQEPPALAKQRLKCGLVVFLAVERSVLRESLLNTFWPDREPERARHALSQTLYELRKLLGEDWLIAAGDRMTVADHVRCDAVDFITAVEAGELQAALQSYGGAFLANCYLAETREFEEWIDRRQDRLVKLLRRALREASQLEETPAWIEHAIEAARRAAEQTPTDDDVQHALLQLLVRAGRRSDALAQYERYLSALAEDKLEPLEHTKQLIAVARETAEPATPQRLFSLPDKSYDLPAEPVSVPPAPRGPRRRTILAGVVIVALAAASPWLISNATDNRDAAAKAAVPRIAVLYFDDLSPRDTFQYFANALTEGLIDEFSRVQGLDVRSKAATKYYSGRNLQPDSIAHGLEVDYLVDGSTQVLGHQLQVIVQLVDAATGNVVQSKPLIRPWSELQQLRDDVVEEVSVLFRRELGQRLEVSKRQAETQSKQAFDNYWRAKQEFNVAAQLLLARNGVDAGQAALSRSDSLLEVAERFDRSWNAPIVLRGQVAGMYAQVAMHHGGSGALLQIRSALDEAIGHANRALKNHANDPEALELRGTMKYRIWFTGTTRDSVELLAMRDLSEADLRKAINGDSLRVEAWSVLSELNMQNAHYAEAQLAARTAYALDRYYARALETLFRLAISTFEQGQEQDAANWCAEGERRFPQSHQFLDCRMRLLAWGRSTHADVDTAQALLDRMSILHASAPGHDPAVFFRVMAASVYARAGDKTKALALLANAGERSADPSLLWVEAAARVRLNQADSALALLERFVRTVPAMRVPVVNSRAFESLRNNVRFERLRTHSALDQ